MKPKALTILPGLPAGGASDEYHVGVIETSDGTLYRESMERSGMPERFVEKVGRKRCA